MPSFFFKLFIPSPKPPPLLRQGKPRASHLSVTIACGACRNMVMDWLEASVFLVGVGLDLRPPSTSCCEESKERSVSRTNLRCQLCPIYLDLGAWRGGGAGHLASASNGLGVRWCVAVYAISVFACQQTQPWLSVVLLRCWWKRCYGNSPVC